MVGNGMLGKGSREWGISEYFSFEYLLLGLIFNCANFKGRVNYFRKEYFLAVKNLLCHWEVWLSEEAEEAILDLRYALDNKLLSPLGYYDGVYSILLFDIDDKGDLLTVKKTISPDMLLVEHKN